MKPYLVSPLTQKLLVRFSGKDITLPLDIQKKINAYWDELMQTGKTYKRGEVFTVTKKERFEDRLEILVEKTDYAHYLYCQDVDSLGEYGVRIIHTASLVDTSDNKTIFGKMAGHTSQSEIYQLCGGGIDNEDLQNETFDFEHNIKKELLEELGIDVRDTDRVRIFEQAYFKEGGLTDKMTVVYQVSLKETAEQFLKSYGVFVENLLVGGESPEFGELVVLEKKKRFLFDFLNKKDIRLDEYVRPLFEYINKEENMTGREK